MTPFFCSNLFTSPQKYMPLQLTKSSKTALLFGATGLVGNELLHQLLNEQTYARVIAPTRRKHHLQDAKLDNPLVDFDELEKYGDRWACHDVYICLGTTIKKAGSKAAFRKVDFDYIVKSAIVAKAGGANQCMLVSSAGADPESMFFYTRVKGETEVAIRELGFWATHIFQPGALVGKRSEFRLGEKIGIGLSSLLRNISPDLLGKYNPTEVEVLARNMIAAARGVKRGFHLHQAVELLD